MNLTVYDNALKSKLLSVFSNVVNASEEKALEYSEDSKASVQLPLISFWRIGNNISSTVANSSAVLKRGRVVDKVRDPALIYKEIYVDISYQIDVWSDRRAETDAILQELLFYFYEEPYLHIEEHNVNYTYSVHFEVTDVIPTNTDLSSFTDTGKLYRQTITIELIGAPLITPKTHKKVKNIPLRYFVVNRSETSEEEI